MRATPCPNHPKREVHARGVCRSCYDKLLKAENPEYAARQRANHRAWVAAHLERNKELKRRWETKRGPEYRRVRQLRRYDLTPTTSPRFS